MARATLAGGRVDLAATLSLEGATIPDGVLTPGAVGEGYLDRRHLAEGARAGIAAVGQGLFRPTEFYGDDVIWSVTVGLRLRAGPPHRMGRYGVLQTDVAPERHGEH